MELLMTEPRVEYGIHTATGETYWDTFINRPVATEQDRQLLVLNLKALAKELGQHEGDFLANYGWVSRVVTDGGRVFEIEDPTVVPPLQTQTEPVPAEIRPEPVEFNS